MQEVRSVKKAFWMAMVFRWMVRLTVLVLITILCAGALVYYLAAQSLPNYAQNLQFSGAKGSIEIIRDTANVPHIKAENDHDIFFALGFVHAQDRLWQMAMLRRTAQGRLSEVFGAGSLESDKLMRRLDLYSYAADSLQYQTAQAQAALSAYAAGVNARIEHINRAALGRGAPEMFLFDSPFAAWQPTDSLALLKLIGFQQSGHLKEEILRAQISLVLEDSDHVEEILPDTPFHISAKPRSYSSLFTPLFLPTEQRPADRAQDWTAISDWVLPKRGFAGASNAFAAAPSRSANQGTLLANDPHGALSVPGQWYLAHLELQSGGVIGGSIPGIPLILTGRSDRLGWAITASFADDQDIYMEQLDPARSDYYKTPTGFRRFSTRASIINIKDQKPVTMTLRATTHGPVFSQTQLDLASVTPKGFVPALAWTGFTAKDKTFSAKFELMQAQNIDQALAALEPQITPSENIIMVDQTRIVPKTVGALPRRNTAHQTQGRMPSLGHLSENQWRGVLSYAQNPENKTPEEGILGNTNNKVTAAAFPNHISFSWGDSQRIQRWKRLMQAREIHTKDSFIEAQSDSISFAAQTLLPLIASDLWYTGQSAPNGSLEQRKKDALDLLASWNGDMNQHDPQPLIYAAWMRALQSRLIQDELGDLSQAFQALEPLFIERVFRDIDGASHWCDIVQTQPVETCEDMAKMALEDALIWLQEHYGRDPSRLEWGMAHRAQHLHPTLGHIPLIGYFLNIIQPTSGGDHTLQRGKTSGRLPHPFHNVHAATYRGVYDLADPDSSVFITTTGQSGHFLSQYYDNFSALWRNQDYIPMSLDLDLARAGAIGITHIRPN